jgi:Flp pilus assembly protein TadG
MSLPMSPTTLLRRRGQGRFASERGVALIEFALVLPFLLLIVFGMVDLGKAVSYWNDETHLANQAARYAAVNSCAACDAAVPAKTINQYVIGGAETNELATKATIAIQFTGPNTVGSKNHCIGQPVKVTVSYDYSLIGFVKKMINWGPAPIHIRASSTMRLEKDWGDATGNYRSGTDKYQATNASPDQC